MGISDHMLGSPINDLVEKSIMTKNEKTGTVPLQVTYKITLKGKQLLRLIDELINWSHKWSD